MAQDELPAKDMAALREAVLGFYEDSVRLQLVPRGDRCPGGCRGGVCSGACSG